MTCVCPVLVGHLACSDAGLSLCSCVPGRGDLCVSHTRAGCVELLNTVQKRVKPKYHVFGHIHEGNGCFNHGSGT